jgi:hypothetical protein
MNPLVQELEKIRSQWGLTQEQLASMTHVSIETYRSWLAGYAEDSLASIPSGMESALPLISIHRRLSEKVPSVDDQIRWWNTKNKEFGDHLPIEVATSSPQHLSWISYYLETALRA